MSAIKHKYRIVLIDDDKASHAFHKIIIAESSFSDVEINEFYSVDEALEYLKNLTSNSWPDLILIDLNMPKKTGWDFIEEYEGLAMNENNSKIFIVSNSEDPLDIEKAENSNTVISFLPKFLEPSFFEEQFENSISKI